MKHYLISVLILFAAACSTKQEGPTADSTLMEAKQVPQATEAPQPEPDNEDAPPAPLPPPEAGAVSRKIIRNAQVRIRVADFRASGRAIEGAVRQTGGQVVSSNETKTDNTIENALVVRVPPARLDTFLNLVLKEAIYQDTKTITADDVTRRYVDIEARIRSKRAVEETYLNLLKRARDVEEILKIEEQLSNIREEREVQEAELRQLKDEVALSTVNLTYYEETKSALRPQEPILTQIGNNLSDGFQLMSRVLVGLFYLLPLGLVIGGVVWLITRWRRNRKNKQNRA